MIESKSEEDDRLPKWIRILNKAYQDYIESQKIKKNAKKKRSV